MSTAVAKKVVAEFILDDSKFSSKLKEMTKLKADFNKVAKATTGVVVTVATAFITAAAGTIAFTKNIADVGDKFNKLSQRIGISTEKLSAYEHVAGLGGTTLAGFSNSMKKLSKNMVDASNDMGLGKKAFDALGISVKDSNGNLKDADTIMLEVAGLFSQMEDGATKTAFAQDLFGRAGIEMIPILNQGTEAMAAQLAEGKELAGWTTAEADASAELNDNWLRMTTGINGITQSIGKQLIPVVNAVVVEIHEWIQVNKVLVDKSLKAIPELIKTILLPAFFAILQTIHDVKTGWKVMWEAAKLSFWKSGLVITFRFAIKTISEIISTFTKLGKFIPGVGVKMQKFGLETKIMAQELDMAIEEQVNNSIENINKEYDSREDFKTKLAILQDSIITSTTEMEEDMTGKVSEETDKRKNIVIQYGDDIKTELTTQQSEAITDMGKTLLGMNTSVFEANEAMVKGTDPWSVTNTIASINGTWAGLNGVDSGFNTTLDDMETGVHDTNKAMVQGEDPWSLTNAIKEMGDTWTDMDSVDSSFRKTLASMKSGMSTMLSDVWSGDFDNFKDDFWKPFMKGIYDEFAKQVVAMIVKWGKLKAAMTFGSGIDVSGAATAGAVSGVASAGGTAVGGGISGAGVSSATPALIGGTTGGGVGNLMVGGGTSAQAGAAASNLSAASIGLGAVQGMFYAGAAFATAKAVEGIVVNRKELWDAGVNVIQAPGKIASSGINKIGENIKNIFGKGGGDEEVELGFAESWGKFLETRDWTGKLRPLTTADTYSGIMEQLNRKELVVKGYKLDVEGQKNPIYGYEPIGHINFIDYDENAWGDPEGGFVHIGGKGINRKIRASTLFPSLDNELLPFLVDITRDLKTGMITPHYKIPDEGEEIKYQTGWEYDTKKGFTDDAIPVYSKYTADLSFLDNNNGTKMQDEISPEINNDIIGHEGGVVINNVFNFQGIDRENAHAVVNDIIIPEIDDYRTSKGAEPL